MSKDQNLSERCHQLSAASYNPYLKMREAKIARNKEKLNKLGLARNISSASNGIDQSNISRKRVAHENILKLEDASRRRSKRLNGKLPYTSVPNLIVKAADLVDKDTGKTQSRIASKQKPISCEKSQIDAKPGSTRATVIDLKKILCGTFDYPIFIGRRLESFGKAAVVEHARIMSGNFSSISFNKYSGVCEFKNDILFLWVNIGDPKSSVKNNFLNEGRHITWFGGSRMHAGSTVIHRLINIAKNSTKESTSGIVLWCRLYDESKRTFGSYVNLGRLGYKSHEPSCHPLRFVFELLDYDLLKTATQADKTNHFEKILSAGA